jgi:hypothetical protein
VINKINKTALALAAALVVGSVSMAQANEKLDPATGLRTEFYYAPLSQLAQEGAPINAAGRKYMSENPGGRNARARAGNGGNGGFNARAQVPGPLFEGGVDNSRSWGNQLRCMPEFNGAGQQVGPYCFE